MPNHTPSSVWRRASSASLVALAAAVALSASPQVRYPLDAPGTWKPWKFAAVPSTVTDRGATAAEVKAFAAQLVALQAIIRRAPGVATPIGFSVETWGNLNGYSALAPGQPAGRSLPLAGDLTFGAFPIFEYERGGKWIREDTGETALMQFHVNEIQPGLIRGEFIHDWGGLETDVFVQPPAKGETSGYPRFGDFVVITKNPASLWTPVSLDAALQVMVRGQQRDFEQWQETVAKFRAQLDKYRDPVKKAARLAGYQKAATQMPDPAAYLAQMEQVEKIQDNSVAEELAPGGGSMKGFLAAERALNDTKAWISSLSAAERTDPACYAKAGASIRTRFQSGVASGCEPIVRPNWQYFNKALPRSAPQLVIVNGMERCFDKVPVPTAKSLTSGCPANRKLLETIDKQAVLDWLR